MSFRILKFCLLGLLAGCSAADAVEDGDEVHAEQDSRAQSLVFESLPAEVLANASVPLVVRYQDTSGGPIENIQVDFSLTSLLAGASLTPLRAHTDAQGLARTELRVGSAVGDLEVRARTLNNAVKFLALKVGQADASRLTVWLDYAGQRKIATYTVTALPGMRCAAALASGLAGEVTYSFAAKDERATFELGAGLTAAIVGWGREATGSKLVRGCQEFKALSTTDATMTQPELRLSLVDLPLDLTTSLGVELELNVAAATHALTLAVERSVEETLTPSGTYAMFAEADYYLDAVARHLTELGNMEALSSLTSLRAGTKMSSSLDPALSKAKVGPKAIGAALSDLLTLRGAGIMLHSSYDQGSLAALSDLTVLSADGTKSLSLPAASLPAASITARFDAPRAALLVESLRIELGLGRYGLALLSGIEAESGGIPASLSTAAGCSSVFGPWWSKSELASVCDVSVAVLACQKAVTALTADIKADLGALDTSSPALVLSGAVQTHDRSEDGKVDDLGPTELEGSWGKEPINGEVRVPVKTAFVR